MPILLVLSLSCGTKPVEVLIEGETMGTTYTVKIISSDSHIHVSKLTHGLDSVFTEINYQMSTYVRYSAINRFNEYPGKDPYLVPEEFLRVVERSLYWTEKTDGAFDITINSLVNLWGFGAEKFADYENINPTDKMIQDAIQTSGYEYLTLHLSALQKSHPGLTLDVNAIAKGFGVDEAGAYLKRNGFTNFMVEVGGEVFCSGVNKNNEIWQIAVQSPQIDNPNFAAVVKLDNKALATSGDYRNFYLIEDKVITHIIDPRTGRPVSGVASASVIADNCTDADALATALMVMGKDKGLKLVESLNNVETMIIFRDDKGELNTITSSGFSAN